MPTMTRNAQNTGADRRMGIRELVQAADLAIECHA